MSQKSSIVQIVKNYLSTHDNYLSLNPDISKCFTQEVFDWDFIFNEDSFSHDEYFFYNLFDGCQFIHSSVPGEDFLKNHIPWNVVSNNIIRNIQNINNEFNRFKPKDLVKQTNIFAFDNSKNVCLAKKPTQNKRRSNLINKETVIILPIDDEEKFQINDHDTVPIDWKKMCIYPKFFRCITDYVSEKILNNIVLVDKKKQKFMLWKDGDVLTPRDYKPSCKYLKETMSNIGEFDFFVTRMMDEVITRWLKKRHEQKQLELGKEVPFKHYNSIFDFSNICFIIHTTDTDIFLFSLYFLEYIKYKLNIDTDKKLPNIIIRQPWKAKTIINVKNVYTSLRNNLEKDNNCGDLKTIIRSYVMTMLSCGNDLLPNLHNVVFKIYHEVFVKYRHLFSHSLLSMNIKSDDPKYFHQCLINGQSFKTLYFLVYAEKLILSKDKKKLNDYVNDPEGLELFITNYVTQKDLKDHRKKIQGFDNIKARLIIINIMLYSIEHSLRNVKGCKKDSLSQLMLPEFTHINLFEEYKQKVNPDYFKKAYEMGIITEKKCIFYSRYIALDKFDQEKEIDGLIELAKNVYYNLHMNYFAYNRFRIQNKN